MKVLECQIHLKSEMDKESKDKMPAWLRAKASVTLEGGVTLHGVVIREATQDLSVFCVYPKDPERNDQYGLSDTLQWLLEPQIIKVYQRELHPWLSEEHEKPLHSMSLALLSELREDYRSVAAYCTQRDVDLLVSKLHRSEDWDKDEYDKVKAKVKKIAKHNDEILGLV